MSSFLTSEYQNGSTAIVPIVVDRRPSGRLMAPGRRLFHGMASLSAVVGIALLVPFAILLVGLPVALVIRGLLEVIGLVFGVNLR
jgi:tetrahydromethanopterin S-methyltransferase subunit F